MAQGSMVRIQLVLGGQRPADCALRFDDWRLPGWSASRPRKRKSGAESTLSFLMALLEMRKLEEFDGTGNKV
jgi:hypothetical protein